MEEYLDSKTKRCRMLFHNMISLSVILGLILRQLYSPKVKSLGHNCTGITTMVARLKAQLADWYESVPEPWKLNDQDIERIRQARTIPLDAELKEKIETAGKHHFTNLVLHSPCSHLHSVRRYPDYLPSNLGHSDAPTIHHSERNDEYLSDCAKSSIKV
jgi:hypothetical protein